MTARLDLSHLDQTLWLCEPVRLRQAVLRVLSHPSCPTPRELAARRSELREEARAAPSRALEPFGEGEEAPPPLGLAAEKGPLRAVKGKVGVIGLYGPVDQRMSGELEKAGGTALEFVSAAFDVLLAEPGIGAIVLHVDSPGGTSYGVQELSDKVYAARGQKPTFAAIDSLGASAAYWIASAAETVVITPGGDAGSVGVYAIHIDESKALEAEGLTVSLVKAGKYKAEQAPFAPLSEEARTELQAQVDYTYGKFQQALRRNRDTTAEDVRTNYGQGRLLNAQQALRAGLVDRVMSFDDLLRRLTGGAGAGGQGRRAASLEDLRARQEERKRKTAT